MRVSLPLWRETTFSDLAEFFDHKRIPLSRIDRELRPGPYPYYGASGVIDHIDDYIFDGRYLLIAEDGENLNSRKTPIAFFANGKFWVNNHAHVVRALGGRADDSFLKAWFDQANISGYITGAAQPKLSQANLRRIQIRVPGLPIQRKIAAILSAYDDLIENNLRRIKILEEMAQNLYREWFVKFRYPGHENVRFVDSPLGRIPERWEASVLGQVCSGITDGAHSSPRSVDRGKPMASVKDLTPYGITFETCRHISAADFERLVRMGCQPTAGDVLIAKDGASALDTVCLLDETPRVVLLSSVAILRPDIEKVLPCILHRHLAEEATRTNMKRAFVTGAAIPRVILKDFARAGIVVPPIRLQEYYSDRERAVAAEVRVLTAVNNVLRRTRDLLLPRLISGELDVSTLDIAIPEGAE